MTPFLDKIAARLIDKFSYDMSGVAVVLPSKRSKVFLKHYISKKLIDLFFYQIYFQLRSLFRRYPN